MGMPRICRVCGHQILVGVACGYCGAIRRSDIGWPSTPPGCTAELFLIVSGLAVFVAFMGPPRGRLFFGVAAVVSFLIGLGIEIASRK